MKYIEMLIVFPFLLIGFFYEMCSVGFVTGRSLYHTISSFWEN